MRFVLLLSAFASLARARLYHHDPQPLRDRSGYQRTLEIPLLNDLAHQRYLMNLSLGTPPQRFSLMPDTASSTLWVPKSNSSGCAPDPCPSGAFNPADSSTIKDTGYTFRAIYGLTPDPAHMVVGPFYNDTISLGPGVSIPDTTFAVGDVPKEILAGGIWGILGLGSPLNTDLAREKNITFPVLWERLYESGHAAKRLFSVWLNEQSSEWGSILFGGIDGKRYEGELKSTPLVLEGRNREFTAWAVNMTSITRYDGEGGKDKLTPDGFVLTITFDTGSPNIYIPDALYSAIAAPMKATMVSGAPYVLCSFRKSTSVIEFGFGGNADGPKMHATYKDLIYPFGLPNNANNAGEVRDEFGRELCYLGVLPNGGSPAVLIGHTGMRGSYVVFDAEEKKLWMGKARYGVARHD
ncbi:acid protease [Polyplosphaeria fusca]|uniref:Acid protease n=1 Tax=Polyplosphaeria fusca TaxID=682080 RepID=A0A9P4R520_9PLEO|nr:acid protease [Polyplosphaeria fusca]